MNWISIEKKTWQTATIDKDDSTFSVVYSFLKIKSKAYIFKNVFKIPWNMQWARICLGIGILIVLNFWSGRKNHVRKKVLMWYNDFAFHVGNHVGICQMLTWVRKTVGQHAFLKTVCSRERVNSSNHSVNPFNTNWGVGWFQI